MAELQSMHGCMDDTPSVFEHFLAVGHNMFQAHLLLLV